MKLRIPPNAQSSLERHSWSKRMLRIAIAGIGVAASAVAPQLMGWQASAQILPCGITQITNSTASFYSIDPSISGDGTRIAFTSDADLTGGNTEHNREVFVYNTETNNFIQVTHTSGSGLGIGDPSISSDGSRVVFMSNFIFTDDIRAEISLYDMQTGNLTQITNSAGNYYSGAPSISGDGTRISFTSNADLTGDNPDHKYEFFLYDTQTGGFTQISHSTGDDSFFPMGSRISSDGTHVVFESNADLTGTNSDRNYEIFLYNIGANSLAQITNSSGSLFTILGFSINADGTRIAFSSRTGPFQTFELFLYTAETASITQITNAGGPFESQDPSISADGTRIAFGSRADPVGGNPAHYRQIFLYDVQTGSFTQITNAGITSGLFFSGSGDPSINSDGTRIVFNSEFDLTGGNPDLNPEIFLANCLPPPPGPPSTMVYPVAAYTNLLTRPAVWVDPVSGNAMIFDAYGYIDRRFGLELGTNVTGNVTVRNLGNGSQQVVVNIRTIDGLCWGYNPSSIHFGFEPFEVLFGEGPAALGRGSLQITFEPQPAGLIRPAWPIQSIIGNVSCLGALREGSGYPEGTPGIAQTTQTGLLNTGVPGGCPPEHDADCFPAEKVQFKPRGN